MQKSFRSYNHYKTSIITIYIRTRNKDLSIRKSAYVETKVMQEALQLFHEVIFQPNRDEAGFNSSVVMREKATLQSKIEAIYDDKVSFANQRLIDHMCEEEKFSIHTNGYTEDLAEIDG